MRNAKTERISILDVVIFYFLPVVASAYTWYMGIVLDKHVYPIFLGFFGVFLAIFVNIQVALLAIFHGNSSKLRDTVEERADGKMISDRRLLLQETNSNLSYLNIFVTAAMALFLLASIDVVSDLITSSFTVFFLSHFLLTFLMIVKRTYALLHNEFS